MAEKSCRLCSHCGIEPADMTPYCGHPDVMKDNPFGLYTHHAVRDFCGLELKLFEPHPLRKDWAA